MTTTSVFAGLAGVVADLSRELPMQARYDRLLESLHRAFPADALALLQLDAGTLVPRAVRGLSHDTLGRVFPVGEHPRLAQIMSSRNAIRFPADSALPDPYDGLVDGPDNHLYVHDCLGISLYVDGRPWGAVTLDALSPDTFDALDPEIFTAYMAVAAATVCAADWIHRLEEQVDRHHQVNLSLSRDDDAVRFVGDSAPMRGLHREARVVAPSDLPVLILGETGVGKELVARLIHRHSGRAEEPMIHVNCAALPESIAESELFGHVRGAFSGAVEQRIGKFELAHRGTLFLDEIGELAPAIQAKLLRALQNGDIQRLGSDSAHRVDVRIVAATNRDLRREVAEGRFRADLYHRLSVYPLIVPPLRDRKDDILPLAGHFLEKFQRKMGLRGVRLEQSGRHWLRQYDWPGNVRELEHCISRAIIKALSSEPARDRVILLTAQHLGAEEAVDTLPSAADIVQDGTAAGLTMSEALERYQRELIRARLRDHGDNLAATARSFGLDRGNFHRLLKRLGLR